MYESPTHTHNFKSVQKSKVFCHRGIYLKTEIRKPNKLIQAGQHLSATQSKIIFSMLGRFKYLVGEKDLLKLSKIEYKIPLAEVIPNYTTSRGGKTDKLVHSQVENLMQHFLTVKKGKKTKRYNLISYSEVEDGGDTITTRFNVDVLELLVEMTKDGYTKIAFEDVFKLKSSYSIRIFEKLKRQKSNPSVINNGYYEISLEDLKFALGLEKTQYPRWAELNRRVITPAHEEIEEKTDLRFEITPVKESRKIVGIRFENILTVDSIIDSSGDVLQGFEQISLDFNTETFTTVKDNPLLESLSSKDRRKFETEHSAEYIKHYFDKTVEKQKRSGSTFSFGGYLFTLLSNDDDEYYQMVERKAEDTRMKEEARLKEENEKAIAEKAAEERQKKLDNLYSALDLLFSNLNETEKKRYEDGVVAANPMYENVKGDTFKKDVLQSYGKDRGLWDLD